MTEAAKTQPTTEQSFDHPSLVDQLESQLSEMSRKYTYLYAEMENVKKRAQLDRVEINKFGIEKLAKDLLEVVDSLERSLKHMSSDVHSSLREGLNLTLTQFKKVLEKYGIRPISAEGELFDPYLHEATGQINSNFPQGTIVREERRGYQLHDRLLRPSRVLISNGSGQQVDEEKL